MCELPKPHTRRSQCENDFPPKTDMKQAMANYSIVYDMAVQRPPHNYCEELYTRYKNVYVVYLRETVLPALRERGGAFMLAEIGQRWKNHRDVMVKWMKKFFMYLDQYYTKREKVPSVYDTGMIAFKDTMFPLVKDDVTTAILELVAQEREGESIDRDLLKSVVVRILVPNSVAIQWGARARVCAELRGCRICSCRWGWDQWRSTETALKSSSWPRPPPIMLAQRWTMLLHPRCPNTFKCATGS